MVVFWAVGRNWEKYVKKTLFHSLTDDRRVVILKNTVNNFVTIKMMFLGRTDIGGKIYAAEEGSQDRIGCNSRFIFWCVWPLHSFEIYYYGYRDRTGRYVIYTGSVLLRADVSEPDGS